MRNDFLADFYQKMVLINTVESTLLNLFAEGLLRGTVHTCLGQEAIPTGVSAALEPKRDIVCSNHRGHGHFLAFGGAAKPLIAEIMGDPSGICGGIGGSQHIQFGNFYSNGILGGMSPVAAGMALAEKRKGSGAVVVQFLGDGALAEGIVAHGEGLVDDQHVAVGMGADGEGEAGAHAAGIELHRLLEEIAEAAEFLDGAEPFGDLRALEAENGARQIAVLAPRQLVVEGGPERQHRGDAALDGERADGGRGDAAQNLQEGRLARAVASDDADRRALGNGETDLLQRPIFVVIAFPAAKQHLLHLVDRAPVELIGLAEVAAFDREVQGTIRGVISGTALGGILGWILRERLFR